ncbi:Kae1-like domain-containing protein [Clostridium perfringens]|uniref:Kae1-like domain-containing protein n=1 Tax=Clostridium perfringens TaxID=1502 RepID=UPI0038FC1C86
MVALSGGVFENEIIFTRLYEKLNNNNFQVLTHKILPCNDSNLSVGQLIIGMNKE